MEDSLPCMLSLCIVRGPFEGLKTFSLAIPHINLPLVAQRAPEDIWVKLLTLPASALPDPCTPEEIERLELNLRQMLHFCHDCSFIAS